MNDAEHLDGARKACARSFRRNLIRRSGAWRSDTYRTHHSPHAAQYSGGQRSAARTDVLYDRWRRIGFAFGAAVSYVNFRSLTRGVESLADRIVNRNSAKRAVGSCCVLWCDTGLVAAVAYAIFKGSSWRFAVFCGLVRAGGGPDGGAVWRVYSVPAGVVRCGCKETAGPSLRSG